ncbi:MAG TPA: putative lipid II flippase FtsW [Actinomycetota bacterium]|nr:putative lipid II flippase FtsW [Actinomycetota bacterium]
MPTWFLTAMGLVMVLSAGSVSAAQGYDGNSFWYFQRQVIYAVAGLSAGALVARLPYAAWRRLWIPVLGVSSLLMLVAAHPASGTSLYGASRWIDLGPVTLQPSEFAKLGLITFAATVLTAKRAKLDDPVHLALPLAPVVMVVAGLGVAQRDLGTTVIICGSVFLLLFVAGVRLRYLAASAAVGLIGVAFLIVGEPYRRTRFFDAWLNPQADASGAGYQLIQGLIAIGSGGWTGLGLGSSRAKWDYLPNAHSDFIFAVIAEELGLLGALTVLVAFGVLLFAAVRIALHATDTFGRLLAAGVASWIGLQTVINLGAVTGLLPITGVPLPLVSFGGTALVVTLAGIGVLVSVARGTAARGGTNGRGARDRAEATRPRPPARKAPR